MTALALLGAALAWAGGPTYADALRAGREAERAGRFGDAVAAFERAIELAPRDPTALGELGWAAFEARDFPKAEAATKKALAASPTAAQRPALLYNLGRISEAQGADPVPSYVESLRLRQDEAVRAHLRLLQPTLADGIEPFAARPLAGPFASIAAACSGLPPPPLDDTGHDFACECADPVRGRATIYDGRLSYDGNAATGGPFEKIVVRARTCTGQSEHAAAGKLLEVVIAVELGGKWFASAIDSVDRNSHGGVHARVNAMTVAGNQARIDYTIGGNYQHHADDSTWSARAMVVIGAGTKAPSLTHPIVFEQTGFRRGAASFDHVEFKRTVAFGDAAILVDGAAHALAFP